MKIAAKVLTIIWAILGLVSGILFVMWRDYFYLIGSIIILVVNCVSCYQVEHATIKKDVIAIGIIGIIFGGVIPGIIILCIPEREFTHSKPKSQQQTRPRPVVNNYTVTNNTENPTYREQPKTSISNATETLRQLKQLLDEGIITQEEFDVKKAEILSKF